MTIELILAAIGTVALLSTAQTNLRVRSLFVERRTNF